MVTIQALRQTPNLVIHAPRAPPERVLQYSVCKLQSVFLTCEELWPPCGSSWPLMVGQRLWERLRVMLCPGRVQDMCSTASASPHGSLETPANEWEQTSIPMTRQLDGGSPWSGSRLGAPQTVSDGFLLQPMVCAPGSQQTPTLTEVRSTDNTT